MKCSESRSNFSLYLDDILDGPQSEILERHLEVCPPCRVRLEEIRSIRNQLRQFGRPEMPSTVAARMRLAVRDDIRESRNASLATATKEWVQMRLIPLAVGIVASVIVGISFLSMMFSGAAAIGDLNARSSSGDPRIMLAANRGPARGDGSEITPADYARTRLDVAGESPSINPQGALISLSRSLVRSGMKNGEVVVVADVFSDGLARIAEVVEPSQNAQAVEDLEKALVSDPVNAPFVTADLDKRSDNVRVVLRFQSVDVNSRPSRRKL